MVEAAIVQPMLQACAGARVQAGAGGGLRRQPEHGAQDAVVGPGVDAGRGGECGPRRHGQRRGGIEKETTIHEPSGGGPS